MTTKTDTLETYTEKGVEQDFVERLKEVGWQYKPAKELDREYGRDKSEAIYWELLREKLVDLNQELDENNVDNLISSLKRELNYQNLMEGNENFTNLLRKGKKFDVQVGDEYEKHYMKLVDFENPENNSFVVVNQFTFRRKEEVIPDLVLLVNGIPLVIGELKSTAQENDYYDAIEDLKNYEKKTPRLFIPALLNIAADSIDYRYGAIKAKPDDYYPWRETPEKYSNIDNEVKAALFSMFNKETLLDILRYFVFFSQSEGQTIKIVPRYMQYYAANRIINRISEGEYKRGLIWHTQGSGKSFTMFFTAYKIHMTNPIRHPINLILVDRSNLNKQMKNNLNNIDFPNFEVAKSGKHLENMLTSGSSRTILTTIQKFKDVTTQVENENIVVLSDEAHRFMEKSLGNKLEYALPNSFNFGFTGTPVRERERDTFANFMPKEEEKDYLHYYSIAKGVRDNLILPVYFEPKQPVWELTKEEMEKLDLEFDKDFNELTTEEKSEAIKEYVTKTELSELRPRVQKIVDSINDHYSEKLEDTEYKAMVVTPSRKAAALYKEELDKIRDPEESEVIYSKLESTEDIVTQYYKGPDKLDQIIEDFEDPGKKPEILIVCDMLLTGFDAPILKVMYLDRPLKDHKLLQAIARTNRPRKGKYNGLIVDYQRVFENLDEAFDYGEEIRNEVERNEEDLKEEFRKKLEKTMDLFDKVEIEDSSESLNKCVNLLSKNPVRRKSFKENYRKLQDIYETISPDKFLAKEEIHNRYKTITQINLAFKRQNRRDENPEEDLRRKTIDLIEEHVNIKDIKESYPVYKISYEHLEKIKGLNPSAKAAEIAYATRRHVKSRVGTNPKYLSLSKRLEEVTSSWQSGELEDQLAAEKLENIEEEAIEIDEAPEQHEMSEGEYAVFYLLTEDYSKAINKKESEELSQDIGDDLTEIKRNFPEWYTHENAKKQLRQKIISLLHEHDKLDTLYSEDFLSNAIEYLIENERRKD